MNFTLSASRISNIFHLYLLGTKSMTLSWHLWGNLSRSARPASWHFCLTHFCPGTWCRMFHRRPGISSVCQPVVASDKDNLIDYTDWRTTKGKADTVSACCLCAHTCTLCVFVFLFNALQPTSCSHWNPQLSHCVQNLLFSHSRERSGGKRRGFTSESLILA